MSMLPNRRLLAIALHNGEFPFLVTHPLWLAASFSFTVGCILGTLLFLLWRLAANACSSAKVTNLDETSGSTISLFSTLIQCADDLSFLNDLDTQDPPLEVIGRGGCGEVYKAELFSGGRRIAVAIKKTSHATAGNTVNLLEAESYHLTHRMRQVWAEIVTVGRMRHPNLLRLLAHVPRPNCHYLVYDYMKNGSLHDALKSATEGKRELGWPMRLRIAIGIAAGLEYLHMVHRPRIIHRDLKPANILLNDNLDARIGDFGLAKLVPDAFSRSLMGSTIAGTVGYIAPEYYQAMYCTDKCDIYSFGVILAVLVIGKFPNDDFFQTTDEMCIMGWARRMMRSENPAAAIDLKLLGNGFEEEMLLVLKIACFCTYDNPNERPNGRDVHRMLSQIKK